MNKARILALLGAVGLTAVAHADFPIPPIVGPTTMTNPIQGFDLAGEAIPAGTFNQSRVVYDWGNQTGDAYSIEAVFVLSSQATFPGGTNYCNAGSSFGCFNDNVDRPGMTLQTRLDSPYSGGNPLFILTQQTFGGSTADWSNIAVTMITNNNPAPTPNATAPALVFPAVGNPSSVATISETISAAGEVRIIKFTVPAGGITVSNGKYIDIDLEGTALAPTNDSHIAIFDSTGTRMVQDDDEGSGLLSAASFGGVGTPRAAIGTGIAGNGRDGNLPSGDYYIYVSSTGDDFIEPLSFAYHGFNYFTQSSNTTAPGDLKVNIRTGTVTPPAALVCDTTETEPNDTKLTANLKVLANGGAFCGNSTGTGNGTGATSYDYFLVKGPTPAAGQILRNRLLYTSGTPSHTVTIRGQLVTLGVADPLPLVTFQTASAATTPARFLQWFSMGTNPTSNPNAYGVQARVAGVAGSTGDYRLELVVDTVATIDVSGTFEAGPITLSTIGTTTTDTDYMLLDGNLNPVPDMMRDDSDDGLAAQATVTGTLAAGTYYLAIGNYNTANDVVSPALDGFPNGAIIDYPGVIVNSSTTANADVTCSIADAARAPRTEFVVAAKQSAFDVRFIKFVVASAGNGGCQPADIADDTGAPLPSAGSNTGVNEGDYNAFFAGFFEALAYCDQWDDAGNPLPSDQPNTGVNEGDYNGFFATFFNGCP